MTGRTGSAGAAAPALLAEVTRGGIVECRHWGHVAVVDTAGRLIAYAGDPDVVTYMRSAAKPVQAVPLVESGAADRYQLSDAELAICCASHSGAAEHRATVLAMLQRAGLTEDKLWCGPHRPGDGPSADELVRQRREPTPVYSNCSGKHTGMLLTCLHEGYSVTDYYEPGHPLQRRILAAMAELAGWPADEIALGVDGCGVPSFALPLARMALVFARLADPSGLAAERAAALTRLARAMATHPVMVAGQGRFNTVLMEQQPDRLVAKSGAEGVMAVGVRPGFATAVPGRPALGVIVKTEDGQFRSTNAATVEALLQLGVLSEADAAGLAKWHRPPVKSLRGVPAGDVRPAFRLHWVKQAPASC